MEPDRARELLRQERERIEHALAELGGPASQESDQHREPGERDSEDLYQDEFDVGRTQDLRRELASVERAEARLADGTYGLSLDTGEPIPDGRLEAVPTAERTVEEQERYERGG
jgi:DnaK suppressor protein